MDLDISAIWERLETFLVDRAPTVHRSLREPVTADEIRALEEPLHHPLPREVRRSLTRHDGQAVRADLFNGEHLMSATDILRSWRVQNEVQDDLGGPCEGFWVPRMIRLTESDGDGFCVDATTGAVWYFLHDRGLSVAPVASSWGALLSRVVTAFERGEYRTVGQHSMFLKPSIAMNF